MPCRVVQFALVVVVDLVWSAFGIPFARAVPAVPAAGFQGIWYSVGSGANGIPNKYGGSAAAYPQQIAPMAVYAAEVNKTFFGFNVDLNPGPGRNVGHAISYYDHETGLVARPQVWLNKGTSDAHDSLVLAMDDDGYIYMFDMTHGESRQSYIRRSGAPFDIHSYVDLLSTADADDLAVFGSTTGGASTTVRYSYAGAWYVPNAETDDKMLLLHTRYQNGDRDLFSTSSLDGDTWTEREGIATIENGQYQTSWIKPDGKTVGTIFNVHPQGGPGPSGLDARTDLYFLQTSDQGQTWQTVDGITLVDNRGAGSNPLTSRPDQRGSAAAQVYDAALGERVYLRGVNYDATGNPIIAFLTSPSHQPGDHGEPGPDRFVHTAYWTGSGWDINQVTATDHNYDDGALYVEEDSTWRIIAPFIDGPQQYGTGGEVGMWTSLDQGQNWALDRQLTFDSEYNHSFVQRPLYAHEDFYAFWGAGDALAVSDVGVYFADKQGQVFRLPYDVTTDFITPELVNAFEGDYNSDGVVNAADYVVWRDTLGSTTDLRADGFPNGRISQRDYQIWKQYYGRELSGGDVVTALGIPEPASLLLITVGAVLLVIRQMF